MVISISFIINHIDILLCLIGYLQNGGLMCLIFRQGDCRRRPALHAS